MNTSKGVIRCKELLSCTKEEILSERQDQSVKDIYNISVKTDSGNRRNTNTFIVTFSTPTVPKYLKIGYIRVPVSIYIPNPLHCFKCQRFGHGSKTCKGDSRCANCGQVGHNSSDCHEQPKCCNCSGTHSASSKECPKWVLEKKVLQIKAEKGISFVEARRIATSETKAVPTPRGQPMAAVVRSGSGRQRPATRTIQTQTDLTWPRDLKQPTVVSSSTNVSLSSTSSQTESASTSGAVNILLLIERSVPLLNNPQTLALVRRDRLPSNHPEGPGRPLDQQVAKVANHKPQSSTVLQRAT